MEFDRIYEDDEFAYAVVPVGCLLVFMGYENGIKGGKIVKRYKDSNNVFGTL